MGIKLVKKKTVSLDTFLVKAISKPSPSATHINLQNAITEAYPVILQCYLHSKGLEDSTSFHFLLWSIRHPNDPSRPFF